MRAPDAEQGGIKAWRFVAPAGVGPADWQAGVATWLIAAPPERFAFGTDEDGTPAGFTMWQFGIYSLRDIAGVPPAKRHFPEATHELTLFTVNPEHTVGQIVDHLTNRVAGGPGTIEGGHLLSPHDLVHQWQSRSDIEADAIGRDLVASILDGRLSPDRPVLEYFPIESLAWRDQWKRLIDGTAAHYRSGLHEPRPV